MAELGQQSGEQRAGVACPGSEAVELVRRWRVMDSGLRRINGQLMATVRDEVGLPDSLLQVVCFLAESPEQSVPMRELAGLLGFSTAGTTGVVDRLVEAGLVERRPSARDRRVIYAALTEEGLRIATTAVTAMASAMRVHVIDVLGTDRVTALEDAVRLLGDTGHADSDDPGTGCGAGALR
jgi:DNA-binding MarR family transcriptional regulator